MTPAPTPAPEGTDSGLATVPKSAWIPLVLAAGAASLPAGHYFGIAIAEGVALTVVMGLFTSLLWWPLRRHPLAWVVVGSVVTVHLLLVFGIAWPTLQRASKGILPIFVIDIFGVVIISDRLARRGRARRLKT